MTHLVTGYAGYEHITSADQGSFNASFFGKGQYVMESGNQFSASITSNSTVRILDGDLLMYGRHVRIAPDTYEDMTIETGTSGKKRMDLIVMEYSKDSSSGVETAQLKVIKGTETTGTATMPEYTNGNILEGATLNQMPLYKVNLDGVTLKSVTKAFTVIPTYKTLAEKYAAQFQSACDTYLGALNILDTKEEVLANTKSNQLTGALAMKEAITVVSKTVSGYSERTTNYKLSEFSVNFKKQGNIVVMTVKRAAIDTGDVVTADPIPANDYTYICDIPDEFIPSSTDVQYVQPNGSFCGQVVPESATKMLKIGYFRKNGTLTDFDSKQSFYAKIIYVCK